MLKNGVKTNLLRHIASEGCKQEPDYSPCSISVHIFTHSNERDVKRELDPVQLETRQVDNHECMYVESNIKWYNIMERF